MNNVINTCKNTCNFVIKKDPFQHQGAIPKNAKKMAKIWEKRTRKFGKKGHKTALVSEF